jgi:hypothetical protein
MQRTSKGAKAFEAEFYSLEMELLDPATRRTAAAFEGLIHPDFVEVGSSGDRYDHDSVIEVMTSRSGGSILIKDFEARILAPSVVLCTYRSIGESGREARRSSIWVESEGRWKVIFHQGTRVPDAWMDRTAT